MPDSLGMGLLMAVELIANKGEKRPISLEYEAPTRFQEIAMVHGLAVYCRRTSRGKYGDWIMVSPPLNVTSAQISEILDGLGRVFRAFETDLETAGHLG